MTDGTLGMGCKTYLRYLVWAFKRRIPACRNNRPKPPSCPLTTSYGTHGGALCLWYARSHPPQTLHQIIDEDHPLAFSATATHASDRIIKPPLPRNDIELPWNITRWRAHITFVFSTVSMFTWKKGRSDTIRVQATHAIAW